MAECCRCHRRLGVLSAKIELLDGVMCTSCFRGLGLPELANDPDNSMGNIRYVARNFLYTPVAGVDAMVQAVLAGRYFSPWYAVGNLAQFDDRRKEVHFSKVGLSVKEDAYIIAYRDLAGCDLLENGKMVERGSLVGAVTGEALFGGLEGALLGCMACAYDEAYCTSMMLKIITRQRGNEVIFLPLIQSKTKCDSASYRQAVEDAFEIVDKIDEIIWAEFDE